MGGYTGWLIGTGSLMIGPHDQVQGEQHPPRPADLEHRDPDVKAEFDRLEAAGATVICEPYKPDDESDMWIATLSDPDDNYFQLMSPM